jgi:hypothetical protein
LVTLDVVTFNFDAATVYQIWRRVRGENVGMRYRSECGVNVTLSLETGVGSGLRANLKETPIVGKQANMREIGGNTRPCG